MAEQKSSADNIKSKKGRPFDVDAWRQFHLSRLVAKHSSVTKSDIKIMNEIIQRYHGQFGNGWISYEMLSADTGVHVSSVSKSVKKLEILGFIEIIAQGRKGRATVYRPSFELIPDRKKVGVTTQETGGGEDETFVGENAYEKIGFVGEDTYSNGTFVGEDAVPSYLHPPADKSGGHVGDENDFDAATPPPPPDAIAPDGAVPSKAGFQKLYEIYDRKIDKAKARDEFNKIDWDAVSLEDVLRSAAEWRQAWSAQGDSDAPRKTLAIWIKKEHYDEMPPGSQSGKPKQRAASYSKPSNDNPSLQKPAARQPATHDVRIKSSSIQPTETGQAIVLRFEDRAVPPVEIVWQSDDQYTEEHGRRQLAQLCKAIGIDAIDDTDVLHGHRVRISRKAGLPLRFDPIEEAA